ncbi:MAG: hypothetical protein J6Y29_06005 [Clostridiales bacterium]|nr:hypothetical protein [Clostridiales bacterium]
MKKILKKAFWGSLSLGLALAECTLIAAIGAVSLNVISAFLGTAAAVFTVAETLTIMGIGTVAGVLGLMALKRTVRNFREVSIADETGRLKRGLNKGLRKISNLVPRRNKGKDAEKELDNSKASVKTKEDEDKNKNVNDREQASSSSINPRDDERPKEVIEPVKEGAKEVAMEVGM